jgi:toluene monooxygenase system ferredoxin subunit
MADTRSVRALEEEPWTLSLPLADLWEGEMVGLRLERADVLLVKLGDDEIRAYDNRCPHTGSRLSDGCLRGTTLRCASQASEFDLRTGDGITPQCCKLRSYPVQVIEGTVMIQLGQTAADQRRE